MRRREFIGLLGGTAVWPRLVRAQQPAGKTYRIAIATQSAPIDDVTGTRHRVWTAFFDELQRLGYDEGRNLAVDWHSSAGDPSGFPELARHIVALKPDAIFTSDFRMAGALKAATTSIPIVAVTADPVTVGLVASLAKPGGNITGFSIEAGSGSELIAKNLALLKEVAPAASRIAWLVSRRASESGVRDVFHEAAQAVGITLIEAIIEPPAGEAEYRRAFAAILRDRADSLYVGANWENWVQRRLIAELAAASRLPAMYRYREHVEAGGLMAYSIDIVDIFRRAAGYLDRVLKGANPGELPFQRPTKYELVINLKTAKALGLDLPPTLLFRADEVIE